MLEAKWIGLPQAELKRWNIPEGDMTGRIAFFAKSFRLEQRGACAALEISAAARYRLWINGVPVSAGPEKGSAWRWYYDTAELTPYLKLGENVLAAEVLFQDPEASLDGYGERAAIYAVISPGREHRLAVEGCVRDTAGNVLYELTTGKTGWKCFLDGNHYLVRPESEAFYTGAIAERKDLSRLPRCWKTRACVSAGWPEAAVIEDTQLSDLYRAVGYVKRFPLEKRDIPPLKLEKAAFIREMTDTGILSGRAEAGNRTLCGRADAESGNLRWCAEAKDAALSGNAEAEAGQCAGARNGRGPVEGGCCAEGKIRLKKGEGTDIILDAGFVQNTFPRFRFSGGAGTRVELFYFEKFVMEGEEIARDDMRGKPGISMKDEVLLSGEDDLFEPFWHRTFRFLRIRVVRASEDMTVYLPEFLRTGYPMEAVSAVTSSGKWPEEVYAMCVRTLQSCAMETYMDCPMFEQMQFIMDTRLQMLFHYTVNADTRLARKTLKDLHEAILPCGLLPGKAPCVYPQIISTFSFHYIFMLWEYYEQTGDLAVLREYRSDPDRILDYFDARIEEESGLVGWPGYWPFVDWADAWSRQAGVPAAEGEGPSTILNLMYGFALLTAAKIAEAVGRNAQAEEYRMRQRFICRQVMTLCYDGERGLLREGPGIDRYSQHAQSWAVLNGMGDAAFRRGIMERAEAGADIIPVSFCTAFEYFRAMEAVGRYDLAVKKLDLWRELLRLHCGTCPETVTNARSECHAWSALPIYEFFHGIAGIQPAVPGWEKVRIRPQFDALDALLGGFPGKPEEAEGLSHEYFGKPEEAEGLPHEFSGRLATPKGILAFKLERKDKCWDINYTLPEGMEAVPELRG